MTSTPDLPRLHALDGLRTSMMLLGLVLHSATSYTATPLGDAWPYQDAQTSRAFDFLVFIIHLFRMPTFFVIAGFFAAFLYYREGAAGFLRQRARRILLPLAAAWVVMLPLVGGGFFFAQVRQSGWDAAIALMNRASADSTGGLSLMHLWFLYYLLIFYVVVAAAMPVIRRVPKELRAAMDHALGIVPGFTGLVLLSLITIATLLTMEVPALETSVAFLPAPRVLVAYLVFFGFGWLLFNRRDRVPAFAERPWLYFGAAMGLGIAYLSVVLNESLAPEVRHYGGVVLAGLATWLFIFAWIGIFVRYFASPRSILRYIADGSYWVYIVHLPFTIWIPGLLATLALPAVVKFLIVLGGTTAVTFLTYHYLVRNTWIGVFLNGRRYSRALPASRAHVPAAVGPGL